MISLTVDRDIPVVRPVLGKANQLPGQIEEALDDQFRLIRFSTLQCHMQVAANAFDSDVLWSNARILLRQQVLPFRYRLYADNLAIPRAWKLPARLNGFPTDYGHADGHCWIPV